MNYYIGSNGSFVSEDELYHWKYIKREKVNGRWRYYYKDTKYDELKNRYWDVTERHDTARTRFDKYAKFVGYYRDQLEEKHKNKPLLEREKEIDKRLAGWKETRDKYGDEMRETGRELKYLKPAYKEAREKYRRSFGHKVADLLNNSSSKIGKAKKWVSNLFKR